MIEVHVANLMVDDSTNSPVVILQEVDGERMLPIWIGAAEANAIAVVLRGQSFPRPLTHDLLSSVIQGLRAKVSKILISELKDNTFYATVLVAGDKGQLTFDARPSDSIALALRSKCPIFVAQKLLDGAADRFDPALTKKPTDSERAEELRRYLERLSPEDFGKFQI